MSIAASKLVAPSTDHNGVDASSPALDRQAPDYHATVWKDFFLQFASQSLVYFTLTCFYFFFPCITLKRSMQFIFFIWQIYTFSCRIIFIWQKYLGVENNQI